MNIWKIIKKAKDGEVQERDVYFLIGRGRKITNTFNFDLDAKHLEFIKHFKYSQVHCRCKASIRNLPGQVIH